MKFKDKTIIHIGLPKCGSTTFQEVIFPYLDKKVKIEYWNKKKTEKKLSKLLKILRNKKDYTKNEKNLKIKLKKNLIISHEALSGSVDKNTMALSFGSKNVFKEKYTVPNLIHRVLGNKNVILVIIRKPSDYFRSVYLHQLNFGRNMIDISGFLEKNEIKRFDIYERVRSFKKKFSNLIIVKLECIQNNFKFFNDVFGIEYDDFIKLNQIFIMEKKNKSISDRGMKFTNFVNSFLKLFGYSLISYQKYIENFKWSEKKSLDHKILNRLFHKELRWKYFMQNYFDKIIPYKKYNLEVDKKTKKELKKYDKLYHKIPNYKIYLKNKNANKKI